MALSAAANYEARLAGSNSFEVTNALQVFAGALVGVDDSTGRLVLWSDTAGDVFAGIALGDALGDTSASPPVRVAVNTSGTILAKISVTGVSAIANVLDKIYATDDNTFTTSATSNVDEVGFCVAYHTGSTCDVQLLSMLEYQASL